MSCLMDLSIRIAVALAQAPSQLSLRFRGSAPDATTYGPVAAARIAATPTFWTPLLDGDTAIIELAVPQGVSLANATIDLPRCPSPWRCCGGRG